MKILVCGSRGWPYSYLIRSRLSALHSEASKRGEDVTLIHGNAPGADRMARNIGRVLGFNVRNYPADWSQGKKAGPLRNRQMLDQKPDLVIAFQHNGSSGTQDTINEARRRGIPVEVHTA